jgi:hypothetical protein
MQLSSPNFIRTVRIPLFLLIYNFPDLVKACNQVFAVENQVQGIAALETDGIPEEQYQKVRLEDFFKFHVICLGKGRALDRRRVQYTPEISFPIL